MNPISTIEQIDRAIDMTGNIVRSIGADQWANPTPCIDWSVTDVLNHTVGGMRIYAAQLTGADTHPDHESDWLGTTPVDAFTAAAVEDLAAWRHPDAMSGTITLSLGTMPAPMAAVIHLTEILVHGVDLAVAIDQTDLIDELLCAELINLMNAMGGIDRYRQPGIFAPALTEPEHAAPHIRLMRYLGRG